MPITVLPHPLERAARVAAATALVAAVLAGCGLHLPGPPDGGKPTAPAPADAAARRAQALAESIAALPGVAETYAPGPTGLPDDDPADRWVDVDVRTDVTTADAFVQVARASLDAVAAAGVRGGVRVHQDARPGLPGAELAIDVIGGAEALLTTTAAALAAPGVASVGVSGTGTSLVLDDPQDLQAVAALARTLTTGTLGFSTADQRMSVSADPASFDAATAGLLARLVDRPEVRLVFLGGVPPDEALQVTTTSDDSWREIATALAAGPTGVSPLTFAVSTAFREVTGTVGAPLAPGVLDLAPPAPTTWTDDPAAPACTGDDLAVEVAGGDAALGHRYLLLAARNTGPVACVVQGTPEVAFLRESGTPAPDVETGTGPGTRDAGRLVVPPGSSVHAELDWGAMSTAQDPDVTVALEVRAVHGATASRVRVPQDAGGPLDVLAGAAVAVGPWQQTSEAFALDGDGA